nr:YeeE/YedE family protein [Pseudomonas protegens]
MCRRSIVTIDWLNFTPWSSLAGGALIGLAASLFVVANGRIAGISGLLGGVLQRGSEGVGEKALFLLGLLVAPVLWGLFIALPKIEFQGGWLGLLGAGLLVGIGTRYGSGCTSGHGVCGLSRLSPRSMIATGCFMASGFATVFVVRHVLGS